MRCGPLAMRPGSRGREFVPIGFQKELEAKIKYWGGFINICRTVTTPHGNPLYLADDGRYGRSRRMARRGRPNQ